MIAQAPPAMICFPPAALNGGPLETAPAKVGDWAWEPKVDDWRAVIHTPSRTIWNQYGKLSSFTDTDKFTIALDRLKITYAPKWLDVGMMENRHDLMRGCIIVFDEITAGDQWWVRNARLQTVFPRLPVDMGEYLESHGGQVCDEVFLVNSWQHRDPLELYAYLQGQNRRIGHKFYEGLVAKRTDSLYAFGRKAKQTTPNWIKHRFDQGGQP